MTNMALNEKQILALTERMSEAAALPPHDPRRLEVSREVVTAGEAMEQKWLEMIAEDERLRLELLHVEPPVGMQERLLNLPDQTVAPPWRLGWLSVARAAAIAGLIGLGVWALTGPQDPLLISTHPGASTQNPDPDQQVRQQISSLGRAALDHVAKHAKHPHHLKLASNDAAALEKDLNRKVNFQVRIPRLSGGYALVGANICRIQNIDAICTHWTKNGQRYTLIQFCQGQCALPAEFQKQIVTDDHQPYRPDESPQAIFWSENTIAYALVPESALASK